MVSFVEAVPRPIDQEAITMDDTAAPRPSRYDITVETTGLDVTKLPDDGGKTSVLVLHLDVKETHEWFGIGAGQRPRLRRSRSLVTNIQIALPVSRPDYLRSGGDFRRLLVWAASHELIRRNMAMASFPGLPAPDWDAAVPKGVEARVAELAAAVSGSSPACCEVSFRVRVGFVFDEAAALLRACRVVEPAAGGDGQTRRTTSSCVICFEEMEATAWLPGCTHGFHGGCIGMWFEKGSTCPVCRRDKLGYLPPAYKAAPSYRSSSYPRLSSSSRATPIDQKAAPNMALAAATMASASIVVFLLVLMTAPASAGVCDAMNDVVVHQDTGNRNSSGPTEFTVKVSNDARVPVSGIHLWCSYSFRTVTPVDPAVVSLVKHGDCLLNGGGAISPGGSVSFAYTSYIRYDMKLLAATCDADGYNP
ncbi:hypothetical protein HU200_038446 [Digitaria exilis]|uniref:RING-type domain-containing protein n=1 Tax=Digitaria exilis TaxID=1010633 RepID=A0A835ELY9_9POAL|nr:hypothetical protein HU200_038446 [Digitaria exilis]